MQLSSKPRSTQIKWIEFLASERSIYLWGLERIASRTNQISSSTANKSRLMGLFALIFASALAGWNSKGWAQVAARTVPPKNELPITAESFCSGMPTVVQASTKQNASDALRTLCNGTTPTEVLRKLIANPYQGVGDPRFLRDGDGLAVDGYSSERYVRFNVAFSMRIQGKSAVDLLLAEESMLRDPGYAKASGDSALSIQFEVLKPDLRQPLLGENEADIAFKVSQRTLRTSGRRQFNNLTDHDLKLYRMFDNNFDFMVAIRSLARNVSGQSETRPLFSKAIVIRAAITDPSDPRSAIMMTVLNFEVYDQQGQEDAVMSIFSKFIQKDIGSIYSFHQKNK